MIDIVGLKQNVKFLNWAVAAIFIGGLTLAWQIDTRFSDKLDAKINPITNDVVVIKIQQAQQGVLLEQIAGKLNVNDDVKTSAGSQQPNAVRERTPARP